MTSRTTTITITRNDACFMAQVWGHAWADDIAYGSGGALLPLMSRLAAVGPEGGTFDASTADLGISPEDAYGVLRMYDPEGYYEDADRDAFVARLIAAAGGAA